MRFFGLRPQNDPGELRNAQIIRIFVKLRGFIRLEMEVLYLEIKFLKSQALEDTPGRGIGQPSRALNY